MASEYQIFLTTDECLEHQVTVKDLFCPLNLPSASNCSKLTPTFENPFRGLVHLPGNSVQSQNVPPLPCEPKNNLKISGLGATSIEKNP